MTSTCPWGVPATEPTKPQPSMQDLMDEAMALSLYEEEVNALQREINPEYQSSIFTTLERSKERREQDRNKDLLNADSFDFDVEASGEGAVAPSVLMRTPAAAAGDAALARARVNGSLSMEDAAHGAGSDGVMDERTTLILQKMINKGELDEVHGCVQSGKEAHVYFAMGTDEATMRPVQLAVKIFRTTLNEFGNRHEYVTGDRRFDLNFQKKDQRRQIKAWTDKEFRNLSRAAKCNIRAPTPGCAGLSPKQQARTYADILQATRALYQRAHLVHGDLSEYNILFAHREKRIWLIDFGQAVDRSHPDTENLLRRDLHTINRFFQRGDLLEATADRVGLLSDEKAYEYAVSKTPKEVVAEFLMLASLLEEMTDEPEVEVEAEEHETQLKEIKQNEDAVQDKTEASSFTSEAVTISGLQTVEVAQSNKQVELSESDAL
ncbi:RIO1 family [Phytophthora infestans]|uniref:non-specific serine/threonine protein kinase n=1 Tax=Phytophthora infestans TaxID=4787 RepID=A0A833S9S8_PHYIN|nr:RIO1 family [Phytophthora infestans]